ncbi:MAG: 1,4-dihydroxy-2-naphthoate polyprenyltransferase [Polyangiaceae bacterium]|nr:1,4-dihydroxy-2-naphthoate polyprenyltransferase [Polyangiaceae bacterium]
MAAAEVYTGTGGQPLQVTPGSFRAWVMAARPATLTAAIVPVMVGTSAAYSLGEVRKAPAVLALVGAILIQIATNFANDVFDAEKGADTAERLGPTRAVQAGLLTAKQVRKALVVTVILAVIVGLGLTYLAGWPVVAIGIASILSGIAYTGGPYPLGYHGLGDVFVMLFFGFVAVCGTAFVDTGSVPPVAIWASIPVGAIATCILIVNNLRDRHTDVKAGKRTLAVRLGRTGVLIEYALMLLAAYAVPSYLAIQGGKMWMFLPLLSLPVAALLFRRITLSEGKPLNACLANTAKLLLLYGVLFSAGFVLSRATP